MYGDYRITTRVIGYGFGNLGTLITPSCHLYLYNPGPKYVISSISGVTGYISVLVAITTYRMTAVIGKIHTLRLACTVYGFKIYIMINSEVIFDFINYEFLFFNKLKNLLENKLCREELIVADGRT